MSKPKEFPEQEQKRHPGREYKMDPQPEVIRKNYKGSEKLKNKKAVITGGDSGIGRSVAVHFAREGADVAIFYKEEDKDARDTKKMVEAEGKQCLIFQVDVKSKDSCENCINEIMEEWDQIDILVNNAAIQIAQDDIMDISEEQLRETFDTNIIPMFLVTQFCLPHMPKGSSIINTTSITSFRGSAHLLDYASTKGAITAYTRSLAKNLAPKGIRVNCVAPGPIWTPLIPSSFDEVAQFGSKTELNRAGQPSEVAPAYVLLASEDGSYIVGETIHINGGEFVGG
ncbi:MAG: SDR family oxidoreductase [Candidatus Cyclobacteriaceae bacterium M2_1C_046]